MTESLPHTSASQIGTYRLCARRWWFRWHRPDIKEPSTPEQDLGTKIHDAVEHYYKTSERKHIDHEIADASITEYLKRVGDGLPPLGPGDLDNVRAEYPADYGLGIQLAGVPVRGRIDLLWSPTVDHLEIYDHKSVGNWKYAKSAEDLERDTQLTIYGAWAFQKFPTLSQVRYHHGQIGTKRVKAELVSTEPLTKDHVFGVLPSVEKTVGEMRDLYPVADEAQVPYDGTACDKFGRPCPYKAVCPRSILSAFTNSPPAVTTEGVVHMSLAEKLKARAAQKSVAEGDQAAVTQEAIEKAKDAVRAQGVNPPDAAKPDMSRAGSYAATATATPPPAAGATTSTAPDRILQFFSYAHLPAPMQAVSKSFCDLAETLVSTVPANPERTVALRKLLEAKDAAVRAGIYKEPV